MGDQLVLALVCAVTFFGAGRLEARAGGDDYGALLALLSALVSAVVVIAFKGSWTLLLFCQVGLFVAIGVVRAIRGL